jgi:hypothetical protein
MRNLDGVEETLVFSGSSRVGANSGIVGAIGL